MTDEDYEYLQNALRVINTHTLFTRSDLDRPFRRWHRKGRPELKPTLLLAQLQELSEKNMALGQEHQSLIIEQSRLKAQIAALCDSRTQESAKLHDALECIKNLNQALYQKHPLWKRIWDAFPHTPH